MISSPGRVPWTLIDRPDRFHISPTPLAKVIFGPRRASQCPPAASSTLPALPLRVTVEWRALPTQQPWPGPVDAQGMWLAAAQLAFWGSAVSLGSGHRQGCIGSVLLLSEGMHSGISRRARRWEGATAVYTYYKRFKSHW